MEKKNTKAESSKVATAKPLKAKLITAVHKALNENKASLTDKLEKVVKKSIKRIVKKTDKQMKKTLKRKQK